MSTFYKFCVKEIARMIHKALRSPAIKLRSC